jgi:F subunit of K+-transporting ATPase (Potass_KdpF)
MSFDNAMGLVAAVLLVAFLIFVLVFPEKF